MQWYPSPAVHWLCTEPGRVGDNITIYWNQPFYYINEWQRRTFCLGGKPICVVFCKWIVAEVYFWIMYIAEFFATNDYNGTFWPILTAIRQMELPGISVTALIRRSTPDKFSFKRPWALSKNKIYVIFSVWRLFYVMHFHGFPTHFHDFLS